MRDVESGRPARQWIWWTLLAVSEALARDAHRQHLPGNYELPHLAKESPDTVRSRMGSPVYPRIAMEFWSDPSVPDADIHDFVQLIQLCRQLRKTATERNMDLWEG
ncbi:hypothetical protein [Halorhodospira halophila]|nr:hypothetical protein [Halorhodospira halophila]